jgi:hypothetical protein
MTPADVAKLSPDEVFIMAWERKDLIAATGEPVTGTASELAARGMLPKGYNREKSFARELLEKQAAEREEAEKMEVLEARLPKLKGRHKRRVERTLNRWKRKQKRKPPPDYIGFPTPNRE